MPRRKVGLNNGLQKRLKGYIFNGWISAYFFMGLEKNHTIYTAEDIRKYFSQKLTPAEMHAMEKAALEDFFLAEAMEGYYELKEKDWESQLKFLTNHFKEKQIARIISLNTATPYRIWKVAAAAVMLCSGIAITYLLTKKTPVDDTSIAANNLKQDSGNNAITGQTNIDTVEEKIKPPGENIKTVEPPLVTNTNKSPSKENKSKYLPGRNDKEKVNATPANNYVEDQLKGRTDLATNKAAQAAQQKKPEQFETKINNAVDQPIRDSGYLEKSASTVVRTFTAKVVGPAGSPLPFANIRRMNDQPGTYANASGDFSLNAPDSLLDIEIKSIGYITQKFTLRSDAPKNKLELAVSQAALNEMPNRGIASANGTKRKKASIPDTVLNAVPADGWDNYEIYIANNLILPNDIVQKKIHGEVEISFEVQSDGTLKNFKIEKSLCGECDEAALRVIREGPLWKVTNEKYTNGKVKVKF